MAYVGIGPYGGKVYTTGGRRTLTWTGTLFASGVADTSYQHYKTEFNRLPDGGNPISFYYPDTVGDPRRESGVTEYAYEADVQWAIWFPRGIFEPDPSSSPAGSLPGMEGFTRQGDINAGPGQIAGPPYDVGTGIVAGQEWEGSAPFSVTVHTGFGSSKTVLYGRAPTRTVQSDLSFVDDYHYEAGPGGTFEFSIDVEDCIEYVITDQLFPGSNHGEPNGPFQTWARKFERSREGGAASMTFTAADGTIAAVSDTITADLISEIGNPNALAYDAASSGELPRSSGNYPTEFDCSTSHSGIDGSGNPVGGPATCALTCAVSDGDHWDFVYGVTGWPGEGDISVENGASATGYGAAIKFTQTPTRSMFLDLRTRAMNRPHTDPITVQYGAAGTIDAAGGYQAHTLVVEGENTLVETQQSFSCAWSGSLTPYTVPDGSLMPWVAPYDPLAFQQEIAEGPDLDSAGEFNAYKGSFIYSSWSDGAGVIIEPPLNPGDPLQKPDYFTPRMLISGAHFDAATIEHVADGPSITGDWSSPACTLAAVDAGESITVPDGIVGSAILALSPAQEWQAYRKLKISITSVVNDFQVFDVQVNGKRWENLLTGKAGEEKIVYIDLMAPNTQPERVDVTHSDGTKWPLVSVDEGIQNTNDGPYWGVTYAPQITFDTLAPGETYIVGEMHLHRDRTAAVDVVPEDGGPQSPVGADAVLMGGPDGNYVFAGAVGYVDGRKGLEEAYAHSSPGNSPPYTLYTILDLLTAMGARPGWIVTPTNTPLSDGYHNDSLPAPLLMGCGAYWDETIPGDSVALGAWVDGFDLDCTSPYTLQAADAIDVVTWYPGCGSSWMTPYADDGAFPIRMSKIVMSGVRGICLDNAYQPFEGQMVEVEEVYVDASYTPTGFAPVVDCTAAMDGSYVEKSPLSRNDDNPDPFAARFHIAFIPDDPEVDDLGVHLNQFARPLFSRRWATVHFRSPHTIPKAYTPWNFAGEFADFHRANIAEDGGIYYWHSDNVVPPWDPAIMQALVHNDGKSSYSRMVVDRQHANRAILVYQSGDSLHGYNIFETASADDGATWETPTETFFLAQFPTIAVGQDGTVIRAIYVAANDTTGTIQATIQQPGDLAPGSAFTLSDASGPIVVASDTFHLAQTDAGNWILHANTGSGTQAYLSTDDARTFTALSGWAIAGGTLPTVAVGPLGEIILLALIVPAGSKSGTLSAMIGYPGAAAAAVNCRDSSGNAISLNIDTFQLSHAADLAGRWVLSCVIAGEGGVSTWFSTDESGPVMTFTRTNEA